MTLGRTAATEGDHACPVPAETKLVNDLGARVRKLHYTLKSRLLPPSDVTCQTKNGLMTFSSKDRSVGRRLYASRAWSWDLVTELPELLRTEKLLGSKNDLLINVGANIGSMLVPLMRSGLFERGIGFEPGPANAAYLRQNITQNGLDECVRTFEVGLSDKNTTAEFELAAHNMGDHRVRRAPTSTARTTAFGESNRTTIEVELARLDDFLVEHNYALDARALFWVDIQGHEGHFFRGARKTMAGGVPIAVELWPYGIHRSGMEADEFCELVGEMCSAFYHKAHSRWQKQPMSEFRALYDRYNTGINATDVVLLTR